MKIWVERRKKHVECPLPSRALKRVNVNIICDYSPDNARAIHRPAQKSHDCGARTCAPRTRVPSSGLRAKSISRSTFNVPREEISGNWPYKVHISRLVTVIPFYSSGRSVRALFALNFFFFFHGRDEISGQVGRPSSPRRTGVVQFISIEPGFERFACHGSGGSEPSAGRRRRGKGAFVPVLVYIPSTDTFRLHRHPVILLPSSPFFCLLGADRCLRKNTESTIDRRHRESFLGCRHVCESFRANVTGEDPTR